MDGDISTKLNEILNDPKKMSAVMGIVSQMTGEKGSNETSGEASDKKSPETEAEPAQAVFANGFSINDDRINLVRALKPFLDEKGREKADKLIKILGLYTLMSRMKL